MILLTQNLRLALRNWIEVSPSRKLVIEAAWCQKARLLTVFFLGFGGAVLEGLTFALLAIALEALSSNSGLNPERLSTLGVPWFGTLSAGRQFVLIIVAAVFFQVIKSILQVVNTQLSNLLGAKAAFYVQQGVLKRILSMKFSSASRFKIGDLTNRVLTVESVAQLFIQSLAWLTNFLTVLAYVVVLCSISLTLFMAALILFGTVLLLQKIVGKKIGFLSQQLGVQQGDLSRKLVEGIGALRLVHAFQRQDYFLRQVETIQIRFIETMHRLNGRVAILGPMSDSLLLLGMGVFLLLGFFMFKENRANLLPDLLTFIAVLNRLSGRITQIGTGWSLIKLYSGRISIVDDLFDKEMLETHFAGEGFLDGVKESIRFEDVELKYEGRQEKALCGVNLNWPAGTSLALVGPSGSGKSSLADLLLGLYEPTSGSIFVDNICLKKLKKESWRNQLGVVSQDTLLFNTSVRENLLFAKPDATDSEIVEAIHSADAIEFTQRLPQGLDTLIGERGFMLSGGQRQRLAIARALLRKPAILILDEATSALDTNAEQAVQATLDALPSGGTRLIIAHRLSTIKNADQIAVLDKGKVVEVGSHDELILKRGLYSQLWHRQTGTHPESRSEARPGILGKEIGVGKQEV